MTSKQSSLMTLKVLCPICACRIGEKDDLHQCSKSLSSVRTRFANINDYLIEVYEVFLKIQTMAYRYAIVSMMAFPFLSMIASALGASSKCAGEIAVATYMFPTVIVLHIYVFLLGVCRRTTAS